MSGLSSQILEINPALGHRVRLTIETVDEEMGFCIASVTMPGRETFMIDLAATQCGTLGRIFDSELHLIRELHAPEDAALIELVTDLARDAFYKWGSPRNGVLWEEWRGGRRFLVSISVSWLDLGFEIYEVHGVERVLIECEVLPSATAEDVIHTALDTLDLLVGEQVAS